MSIQDFSITDEWCSCNRVRCHICAAISHKHRRNVIDGMRAMADLLEVNPAAVLNKFDNAVIHHVVRAKSVGGHDEAIAEVARIAEKLGVDVDHHPDELGDHYKARLDLDGVEYQAVYIAKPADIQAGDQK